MRQDTETSAIEKLERLIPGDLPPQYRTFLQLHAGQRFGERRPREIFGVASTRTAHRATLLARLSARLTGQQFASTFIVIEDLGDNSVACLDCSLGRVVRWSLTAGMETEALAASFDAYLAQVQQEAQQFDASIKSLVNQVTQFAKVTGGYEHGRDGGKLPKPRDWRPYRFCVQDVVLGITTVRHLRQENCLEVDLFVTADVAAYEAGSGARGLTLFLLTEAIKCGGTGEIRFTVNVESGRVPADICRLAARYGCAIEHTHGVITAEEGRELYLAVSELPPSLVNQLRTLHVQHALSIELACFLISHGVWTPGEMEALVALASQPERLLRGGASPINRLAYLEDRAAAHVAALGGMLDLQLLRRIPVDFERDESIEIEDDIRSLTITFEPAIAAKTYRVEAENVPFPWTQGETPPLVEGEIALVGVRPRDVAALERWLAHDIEALAIWREVCLPDARTFLLLTEDALALPPALAKTNLQLAEKHGVTLLRAPEPLAAIDRLIDRKLAQSRIIER